jgi:hypothetical protein
MKNNQVMSKVIVKKYERMTGQATKENGNHTPERVALPGPSRRTYEKVQVKAFYHRENV